LSNHGVDDGRSDSLRIGESVAIGIGMGSGSRLLGTIRSGFCGAFGSAGEALRAVSRFAVAFAAFFVVFPFFAALRAAGFFATFFFAALEAVFGLEAPPRAALRAGRFAAFCLAAVFFFLAFAIAILRAGCLLACPATLPFGKRGL